MHTADEGALADIQIDYRFQEKCAAQVDTLSEYHLAMVCARRGLLFSPGVEEN
ncbi:MAG: hypothetical protein P8Z30_02770 [Acidobacteriota bacterium]